MPLLGLDPGVQVSFSAREDGFSLRLGSLGDGSLVTAVLEEQGEAPGHVQRGGGVHSRRKSILSENAAESA